MIGRLRFGLIVGFVGGYILGSKAGRERYEQIVRAWSRVKATNTFQGLSDKVGDAVGLGLRRGRLSPIGGGVPRRRGAGAP